MRNAREFYEFDATRRAAYDGTSPIIRRRNQFVVDLLRPGVRCLDVGCGAGGFAPLLKERFSHVMGLDLSQTMARTARGRGMETACCDVDESELPYLAETFDAVVCCDVVEHVFDPVQFSQKIYRVLKPGGQFAVSVPNIRYWPRLKSLILGYFPRTTGDPNGYDGGHLHYFASQNIVEVMHSARFEKVRSFGFNADASRRAQVISYSLRLPVLQGLAREFGCSTVIAVGQRPDD